MADDKDTKAPASPPLVEEPEPALAYSHVEPDEVAAVRLFVQVSVFVVVIVLVMLGLWRLLVSQSHGELRRKEATDARNEHLQLKAEAEQYLRTGGVDPKTGKRRLPISEAEGALLKNPALLNPLDPPPAPAGAPAMTAPAMTAPAMTAPAMTAPAMGPARQP